MKFIYLRVQENQGAFLQGGIAGRAAWHFGSIQLVTCRHKTRTIGWWGTPCLDEAASKGILSVTGCGNTVEATMQNFAQNKSGRGQGLPLDGRELIAEKFPLSLYSSRVTR